MNSDSILVYDVIIIGYGPAGAAGSVYISRAGYKVLIISSEPPGGKLLKTYEIENYPPFPLIKGVELATQMYEHASFWGAKYFYGKVVEIEKDNKIFKVTTKKNKIFKSKAILVATGTIERKLKINGEDKYFSKGVSTCAVCDGSLYRDKDVIVVGGGMSALEESIYLTRFVKKVYLIHRREVFRAPDLLVGKIKKHPKIELLMNYVAKEILGDGEKLTSVKIENLITKKESEYNVSAIFPYIGQIPNSDFLHRFDILDENKYAIVNYLNYSTKIKGLYCVGDLIKKNIRQIANAVGEGAIGGQNIVNYLMSENQ